MFAVSLTSFLSAQSAAAPKQAQSLRDRLTEISNPGTGVWTSEQITTMNHIRDAAMNDPYAYDQLAYLTENIGPRPSGSPQAEAAVQRVAAELRALGATVSLEKTVVSHWVRGEEAAALVAWPGMTPGTTQKIVLTALGGSVATDSGGLEAPVIVVNSFAEFNRLPEGIVKGKIVLFNRPFDKELASAGKGLDAYAQSGVYRFIGPSVAASHGAVAVLVRSVGSGDYRLPHTGATFFGEGEKKVPAAAVTAEDADLMAHLARQGTITLRMALTPKTLPPAPSYNVVADWKGTEHPEQIVLVSGHLDSWDLGTGAIDDGAGIVTSMQTIHLLQSLNIHPKRTIRFVAWMDEEFGSPGAATYLRDHDAEIAKYAAVIESDMGADHPYGLTFKGSPKLAQYLAPVSVILDPIGASLVSSGGEIGEDVAGMIAQGVPGFTPSEDMRFYFNYHHTAADTLDKIDRRHLAENAAVVAVTAYAIADAAEVPPRIE
jgi:carboxypeptidase Q